MLPLSQFSSIIASVVEPEPRAEEPKLNAFRSRSRNCELWTNLKEKMVAEEVLVNCYNFNPIRVKHASIQVKKTGTGVKKGNFRGI
jgi:hypothetical protein